MPKKMANELHFFVLSLCLFGSVYCSFFCDSEFCTKFLEETGCSKVSPECEINNATHRGIKMLSPTTCNCCDFCLPLYGLNQVCSVGGPGIGTNVGRCGDGLTCVRSDDGSSYCRRMESACHKAQDEFDTRHANGQTGSLEERPVCDGKGKYAAFACIPTQTCFCQSEEGERIFGEVLYEGTFTKNNMNCGCSRFNHKIKKLIEPGVRYSVVGPRCTSDGNYHPIQCINKICYCVNTVTGVILEGDRRKIDLEIEPLTRLECYDPKLDFFPERNFSTPCLDTRNERVELLLQSEAEGFNTDYHSSVPSCLPDGTYGGILTRRDRKLCVDERGQRIGDYEAAMDTEEYEKMDCKCARTSLVMASQEERPACCKNGNFRSIQCRRGLCRCVDSEGRQTVMENKDVTRLPCYTENWRRC